jgi:hypothetical protein
VPRLLYHGEWFEPLSPGAVYESDYQAMIVSQAAVLFPDFWTARFDCLVESEHGSAKADLALVDRHYRFWWVVEVEMSSHSLSGHVSPQVLRLSHAEYGNVQASYLAVKEPDLDPNRLREMMKGSQPRVPDIPQSADRLH